MAAEWTVAGKGGSLGAVLWGAMAARLGAAAALTADLAERLVATGELVGAAVRWVMVALEMTCSAEARLGSLPA